MEENKEIMQDEEITVLTEEDSAKLIEEDITELVEEVLKEAEKAANKKRPSAAVIILDWVRRAVMLVAIGIYMYSVYSLMGIYLDYEQGSNVYAEVNELFQTSTDASGDEGNNSQGGGFGGIWKLDKEETQWVWNYDTLLSVNEDAVGWIALEGTKVHYPIVQGKDNEYYLTHTIDRAYNFAGTLFVDYRYPDELESNYSIVYGHNLKNGTMLAYLKPFFEAEFGVENNVFDVYIKEKHYHYYVFSVYVVKGIETADSPYQFDVNPTEPEFTDAQQAIYEMSEEERDAYRDGLSEKERKTYDKNYKVVDDYLKAEEKRIEKYETLLKRIQNETRYALPVNEYTEDITMDDHIITISTCWDTRPEYNTRLIIHMVRGEEVKDQPGQEAEEAETAEAESEKAAESEN